MKASTLNVAGKIWTVVNLHVTQKKRTEQVNDLAV